MFHIKQKEIRETRQVFGNFNMKSSRIELVKNGIHAKSGKIKVPRDSIFPRLIKKTKNIINVIKKKKLPCTWYPVAKYGAMFNAIIQFILFLITSHKNFLLNKFICFHRIFQIFLFNQFFFFVSHNFGIFFLLSIFSVYTKKLQIFTTNISKT